MPPGTKVLLHETPDKGGTWAPHNVNGWYIVVAPENYHFRRFFCRKLANNALHGK